MIVSSEFPGDDDTALKRIQHDAYEPNVSRLFSLARERYLAAAALLQIEDELAQRIRPMRTFDHRTLQHTHDRLAARFRYQQSVSSQAHQHPLTAEWEAWFAREVNACLDDPIFTRAVLTAAAYANQDRGNQAESDLARLLSLSTGSTSVDNNR